MCLCVGHIRFFRTREEPLVQTMGNVAGGTPTARTKRTASCRAARVGPSSGSSRSTGQPRTFAVQVSSSVELPPFEPTLAWRDQAVAIIKHLKGEREVINLGIQKEVPESVQEWKILTQEKRQSPPEDLVTALVESYIKTSVRSILLLLRNLDGDQGIRRLRNVLVDIQQKLRG